MNRTHESLLYAATYWHLEQAWHVCCMYGGVGVVPCAEGWRIVRHERLKESR